MIENELFQIDEEDEVEHYACSDCAHLSNCPCIDFSKIQFARPWFACEESGYQATIPCSAFEPASWHKYGRKHWKGFDDYWPKYVRDWLPYQNTKKLVYFTIHGNTLIRYGVPMLDYVYGRMIDGNRLLAVERMRYRKRDGKYELLREPINGVLIGRDELEQ